MLDSDEQIQKYIDMKVDVTIDYNNETGDWQYSILVDDERVTETNFWLDSFPTKKEAIDFCKKHGLRYE